MLKFTGTVVDGVVVFENGHVPPNGTAVEVVPLAAEMPKPDATEDPGGSSGSLSWLLKYAGVVDDLPVDFAAQHDHYIHGTPKR